MHCQVNLQTAYNTNVINSLLSTTYTPSFSICKILPFYLNINWLKGVCTLFTVHCTIHQHMGEGHLTLVMSPSIIQYLQHSIGTCECVCIKENSNLLITLYLMYYVIILQFKNSPSIKINKQGTLRTLENIGCSIFPNHVPRNIQE